MAEKRRILVVDDDADVRAVIEEALVRHGYEVVGARDAAAMRAVLERQHVDLAIIDLTLPRQAGSEHFDDAAARGLPVILISAYPDRINRPPAGYPFLAKPFVGRKLIELLERVLQGSPQAVH